MKHDAPLSYLDKIQGNEIENHRGCQEFSMGDFSIETWWWQWRGAEEIRQGIS